MTYRGVSRTLLLALVCGADTAQAQVPGLPSMKGGMMPDLSSMGAGNAAGVLGYCVKNKYLGGGDASSVMGALAKKPGVESSPGYAAGQAGKIETGKGQSFSLGGMQDKMKSKACDMVLKQGKSLI